MAGGFSDLPIIDGCQWCTNEWVFSVIYWGLVVVPV